MKDLSDKPEKHLVLLTATPHSGQSEEFQSLIGLLNPEFENFQLQTPAEREALSHYFVQRRRADIKQYLGKEMVSRNVCRSTKKNMLSQPTIATC